MEQLAQQSSALLSTPAGIMLLVIGAIAGLIIGLLVAAFGWKRKDSGNAATVNELQNDFDDYKGQVNEHFAKTSDLVGKLTEDYREVYRHLATGSAALCTVGDTDNRIGFDDSIQLADNSVQEQPNAKSSPASKDTVADGSLAENAAGKVETTAKTSSSDSENGVNSQVSPPVASSIPDKIDPAAAKK